MTSSSDHTVDEFPVPQTKSRWLLPCGCVVVLGFFVALPAIAWMVSRSQAARRVDELVAKIRGAGEPTTAAELGAMYRVPDGKVDTTALWLDAFSKLKAGRFEQATKDLPIVGSATGEIPPPGEPWAQLVQAAKLLDQFQDALDKMHAAGRVENGAARFDVKFEDGIEAQLPHVQELRTAVRLLSLEAHVQAHRGNVDGVVESLHSMLAAADAIENEPILVSQLVRIALVSVTTSDLSDLLSTCHFTDEQLDGLAKRFAAGERSHGPTNALLGERILGMGAIRDPRQIEREIKFTNLPFTDDNLVFYLEFLNQAVEASRKPFPEGLDAIQSVDSTLKKKIGSSEIQRVRYHVASSLVPVFDALFIATARETANSRMVRTLIAVEKFQRREKRFPRNLNELVPTFLPAVLVDPCDGQPLRFVASEADCKVYSVGRNRKDDGGQTDQDLDDVLSLRRRKTP